MVLLIYIQLFKCVWLVVLFVCYLLSCRSRVNGERGEGAAGGEEQEQEEEKESESLKGW